MLAQRPFRFGMQASGGPFRGISSRDVWTTLARRAEELGYSTLFLADHVHTALAPIAAMMAAADATTSLRIGGHVFANDFRHPVLLAKEAATIDLLSGGRLELGLGTGYLAGDYRRTGIPLESPGTRVSRFAEGVQIIKGAFGDEVFSFSGTYYAIADFDLQPKPVQRPHPPLIIGGGSRRILSIAGRHADIVSVNPRTTPEGGFDAGSIAPEAFAQNLQWVRQSAGERFPAIEVATLVNLAQVGADGPRRAAEAQLEAWRLTDRLTVEQVLASPMALVGTVEDIIEALLVRRERYGLSYVVVSGQAMDSFAPVVARLAGQ
jgi:probable F420-dependent oxidoreductase